MHRESALSAVALLLAGCMSSPPVDRVAGVYSLFDPSTGMTYNIPLRRSLTSLAPAPVAANMTPTIEHGSELRPLAAPTPVVKRETTVVLASAGPLSLSAPETAPNVEPHPPMN